MPAADTSDTLAEQTPGGPTDPASESDPREEGQDS